MQACLKPTGRNFLPPPSLSHPRQLLAVRQAVIWVYSGNTDLFQRNRPAFVLVAPSSPSHKPNLTKQFALPASPRVQKARWKIEPHHAFPKCTLEGRKTNFPLPEALRFWFGSGIGDYRRGPWNTYSFIISAVMYPVQVALGGMVWCRYSNLIVRAASTW